MAVLYQRNFWTSTASNYKKKLLKKVNISPLFKHVDILVRIRRTNIKRKIIPQRRRQKQLSLKLNIMFINTHTYFYYYNTWSSYYSQGPTTFIFTDLILNLIFLLLHERGFVVYDFMFAVMPDASLCLSTLEYSPFEEEIHFINWKLRVAFCANLISLKNIFLFCFHSERNVMFVVRNSYTTNCEKYYVCKQVNTVNMFCNFCFWFIHSTLGLCTFWKNFSWNEWKWKQNIILRFCCGQFISENIFFLSIFIVQQLHNWMYLVLRSNEVSDFCLAFFCFVFCLTRWRWCLIKMLHHTSREELDVSSQPVWFDWEGMNKGWWAYFW